jgi:hypothetical protein
MDTLMVVLVGHVIGFWLLLFWIVRLRRQVRCLHYCYVNMSDWGIDRLKAEREDYKRVHGEHLTPFTLLNAERDWKIQADTCAAMMKRAGVSVPRDNHFHYVMEDLR